MEILVTLTVNSQKIASDVRQLVSDTVNVYKCHFDFDDSWSTFSKTAVFMQEDTAYEVILDEQNECIMPWEAVSEEGVTYIGVYGTNETQRYPTIWTRAIKVQLGCKDGEPHTPPTIDVYQQILAKYEEVLKQVHTIRFTSLEKVEDYLYNIKYDSLDYEYAKEYFKTTKDEFTLGACSSISKDGLYGRNYDWTYDETVEFLIKTPRDNTRHATIGIGNNKKLTKQLVESGRYDEAYRILPFMLADGINDVGVVCNINVVPKDKGEANGTDLCSLMIPRYVLDNFSTARDAVDYLRTQSIYTPKAIHDMGYELHIMIGDKNDTFVIEFVDGEVVVLEKSFMTNFYLDGVTFNSDGSVNTPAIGNVEASTITEYSSGLERYNLINSFTGSMSQLLDELKFTNAYKRTTTPFWYSEFVGGDITVNSSIAEFEPRVDKYINEFESRTRDGKTWQTVHSSIYDLNAKTLLLKVQESNTSYEYRFDGYCDEDIDSKITEIQSNLDSEIQRAVASELSISQELESEITRAQEIERELASSISDLNDELQDEITRAQGTETTLNNLISGLSTSKADKSNTYTKQEVDSKIAQATPSDYNTVKAQVATNKTDIATLKSSKQDVITDLATIRSNASKGATAVQPQALESYYTKSYVDGVISQLNSTIAELNSKLSELQPPTGYAYLLIKKGE